MEKTYKRLGSLIHEVDIRNTNLQVKTLMGVNLNKQLMLSVANINGTDLSKYKIVKKNQFVCKLMSVGRDACLPIALKMDESPIIISSAYYAFEVNDCKEIVPEYLMLCFLKPNFDKELWFKTGEDVRGGVTWNDFCDVKIPYVNYETQCKIVSKYNAIVNSIDVLKKIILNLEEQGNIFYKKNIALTKNTILLEDIAHLSAGGDTPKDKSEQKDVNHTVPIYSNGTKNDGLFGYTKIAKIQKPSITVSARGYIGYTVLHREPYTPVVRLISITPKNNDDLELLYFYFKNLQYEEDGSAQQQATIPFFKKIKFPFIENGEKCKIVNNLKTIMDEITIIKKKIAKLEEIKKQFNGLEEA